MFSQPASSSNNLRPNYLKWIYKIADTLSIFSGRVIVDLLTWTLEPNDLEVTITTYYSTTPKNVNLRNPSYIL